MLCSNLRADQRQLVDETIERYVEWREASGRVGDAYWRWSNASAHDRRQWCAAYTAALDGEESAAQLYARALDRLAPVVSGQDEVAMSGSGRLR